MFGFENIFFAPLKIMTNQKSPAHFWARFSRFDLGQPRRIAHIFCATFHDQQTMP